MPVFQIVFFFVVVRPKEEKVHVEDESLREKSYMVQLRIIQWKVCDLKAQEETKYTKLSYPIDRILTDDVSHARNPGRNNTIKPKHHYDVIGYGG